MQRMLLNSFVFGLGLCVFGAGATMAQMPAQQSRPQSMPNGSTSPNGPTSRDMNNPNATPGNNPDTVAPTRVDDKKFATNAALGGMTEVELGKLAMQKASSDAVKQFGQKLIDDHTKANEQLKEIAGKESISMPESLDSKHQARVDKLSKLSGTAFDKAFIKDAVKDHEHDVSEFKSEAQNGSDPNIKQFASNTLPVLEEHLTMAKDLSKQEKNSGK
jgi:putative membrane protein